MQGKKELNVDMIGTFGFGNASPLVSLVLMIGLIFVARGLTPPVKKDKNQ
ncbi:MAG: hypothetical protein M0P73_04695 [Syntrophobacterales bacterium]|jgi:hypothetical protein|nr:hypothetical protein [Syntrophobacterales bacterium]